LRRTRRIKKRKGIKVVERENNKKGHFLSYNIRILADTLRGRE